MTVGIMITDGGPHPPEAWAAVTADQIIDISAQAPEAKLAEARAFRAVLVEILTHQHGNVQDHERGQIDEYGIGRLSHDLDPAPHVADAFDDIMMAAKGLSFEAHFQRPEVRDYLQRVLREHFATAMNIERSWFADANPALLPEA